MNTESELIVEQIAIGPMQNFAYLLGSRSTREVVIVDPAWDIGALLERVDAGGYTLTGALVTHYHPDHIGGSFGSNTVAGLPELLELNPVRIYANKLEADGVKKVTGISDPDIVRVESGDTLKVGEVEIEFLHTPGHTPGSQCFRVKSTLVSGDTLFINGKRSGKPALAQRVSMCLALILPGSSASKSSTVLACGNLVNTSRKYA